MALFSEYQTKLVNGGDFSVTIAAGQSVSDAIDLMGASVLAFVFPSDFPAGNVTFMASIDQMDYFELTDAYSGNPLSVVAAPSKYARILPADFVGVASIKLVSQVAQPTEVNVKIVCGPVL